MKGAKWALVALALGCACSDETSPELAAGDGPVVSESAAELSVVGDPFGAPIFALRFLGQAAQEPGRWKARLVEKDAVGFVQRWTWRTLTAGTPEPELVYGAREFPVDPLAEVFVELRLQSGDWFARVKVPSSAKIDGPPIELSLVQVTLFGGRLLDDSGAPVGGAELRMHQDSAPLIAPLSALPLVAHSDVDGRFDFGGVEPGQHHLRVRSEGIADVHLEVKLEYGENEGYTLTLANQEEAKSLPVAVAGGSDDELPFALLALRSLNGQHVWRVLHTNEGGGPMTRVSRSGVGYAALFPGLPAGRYELSVHGLDGRQYQPERVELSYEDLDQGVFIQALPAESVHELTFDVLDATSQQPLSGVGVRFSSPQWWSQDGFLLPEEGPAAVLPANTSSPEWMLVRHGYQPVYGTFKAPASGGNLVETVFMEAGWGCELIFRDGSLRLPRSNSDSWLQAAEVHLARPLEGVQVLADGVQVGRSDANGRLRVTLDERPARLQFRKPGWREFPASSTGFPDAHWTERLGATGSTVVWFDLESGA
ncbi:MAG: hypothetical protein ACI9F9_002655 [Candidatus Paceibacteria bacterium]